MKKFKASLDKLCEVEQVSMECIMEMRQFVTVPVTGCSSAVWVKQHDHGEEHLL